MPGWNIADCLDLIAPVRGDAAAIVQGAREIGWTAFERRARNLAAWLRGHGATHQGKVALYTYNHPAYLEGTYAAFKAALVPLNVNYRYRTGEVRYLLDNADAEFVIAHEEFLPLVAAVRAGLPQLRGVLAVREGGGPLPDWAADYETVVTTDRPAPEVPRSGDDLLFLYTGGTTGMPKGVMWRQDDLYYRWAGGGQGNPPPDPDTFRASIAEAPLCYRTVIGPPLMHGTGWFTAMIALLTGGTAILLDNPRHFDADELWRVVERTRANGITIVGDSFARPMLRALDAAPGRYDIRSVQVITSSGVMWSRETKEGLLRHHPGLVLVDAFSSSEALGMGLSITTAAGVVSTARFQLGERTRLFDELLRPLETAPGVKGLVGVGGPQPVGYYKDPAKTARTFVETPWGRFSVPGDWAVVNPDGTTLTLLGRGSVCINTGGEKVFPEEVEEVIKRFPGVTDAVVVGVPDERWGEAVTAVVSATGARDGAALAAFVREHLAAYKAPKHVVFVDEVYRSPSGKADFARTREVALRALGRTVPDPAPPA